MKVFVTGGSGYIGTQVIPVLLAAGHEVAALARSSELAAKLKALDAEIQVIQGGLEDLDVLEKSAREYDGVIHLAFIHDLQISKPVWRSTWLPSRQLAAR